MAGYDWAAGKSRNAVQAEKEGKRVASKITADWLAAGGITEKVGFIKWLARAGYLDPDERHHASKLFNLVNYYSTEGISESLALMGRLLSDLRAVYATPEGRAAANGAEVGYLVARHRGLFDR